MFNLRFSPEYTPPNDQKRSGGIDSSPVREAGSCSRQSVREALTVGRIMPYSSAILVQGAKKVSRFLGSEHESVSTRVFTGFLLAGLVGRQVAVEPSPVFSRIRSCSSSPL